MAGAAVTEADLRRAVSTAYYGLFHMLIGAASALIAPNNLLLRAQVSRAYSHTTVRKVCDTYIRAAAQPFPPPLATLVLTPPDQRLFSIATAFARLQEGRHTADYDLSVAFDPAYAAALIALAQAAATDFGAIRHLPETSTFLTALLLADRWVRRG